MKALRGMGQQKYIELMYDRVTQRGERYVIDPEGTFTEDGKVCKNFLHKRRNRTNRNDAKESMVKKRRQDMNLLFVKIYRELASRKCLQTTGVATVAQRKAVGRRMGG